MVNKYGADEVFVAYTKARLAQARAERAAAEVRKHKEVLASMGPGQHTVTYGGNSVTFTVAENNTYPEAALLDGLKPGQVQRVTSRVLDRAKFRAVYPARWAAAKVTNGFKVTL